MNKRKILTMAMALCMVAILAVGGSLAYLTDDEQATNVFAVGSIDIELIEEQRDKNEEDGTTEIGDFENGKVIMPVVGSAQGEKDEFGLPVAKNFVDKIVTVENEGKSDAYVRVFVAIPAALVDLTGDGDNNTTDDAVHLSLGNRYDPTGKSAYASESINAWPWGWGTDRRWTGEMDINDVPHYVECYTMADPLASGAISRAVLAGIYMDKGVDYDEESDTYSMTLNGEEYVINYDFDNGVNVPVFVQAVQAAGFETYDVAFDSAELNNSDGSPKNPWAE